MFSLFGCILKLDCGMQSGAEYNRDWLRKMHEAFHATNQLRKQSNKKGGELENVDAEKNVLGVGWKGK